MKSFRMFSKSMMMSKLFKLLYQFRAAQAHSSNIIRWEDTLVMRAWDKAREKAVRYSFQTVRDNAH